MNDSRVILKIFAKKISSKLSLHSQTAQNLPSITLNNLIIDIIELLVSLPSFRSKLYVLKLYLKPTKFRRWVLRFVVRSCIFRKDLSGVRYGELILAVRLAIMDSSDNELIQIIRAVTEQGEKSIRGKVEDFFQNTWGLIGFVIHSIFMDTKEFILGRKSE